MSSHEIDGNSNPPSHADSPEAAGMRQSSSSGTKQHKSHNHENDFEREHSRSIDKGRERGREKHRHRERERDREGTRERDRDKDRDKERDRDRHHRDHHVDRSERKERTRVRDDDDDYYRKRDYDRRRDCDGDMEDKHRHRSRSRSKPRSERRSRSRSRSRSSSKSKRTSGFDMAPPGALLPNVADVSSAVAGTHKQLFYNFVIMITVIFNRYSVESSYKLHGFILVSLLSPSIPTSQFWKLSLHWLFLFSPLIIFLVIESEWFFGFLLCLVFVCCFVWTMLCSKKAMSGYKPHSADNGHELTTVALMYKEENNTAQIPGTTSAIPGMFPNMLPLMPGQFGALPVMPVHAMTQQATRHARRVYVGGLPPSANEQSVGTFFNHVMSATGGNAAGPGDAVVNVYINYEKKFAFVEMRSVEEASNAMALDGIMFEGAPLKVRRSSDYNPSMAATLGPSQPNPNLNLAAVGLTPGSAGGLEGPDRVFVGGLPYYFTESQIRELLESFGPLRGFDLVKDRETGNSKGYAFCVYQDLSVTDIACAALNGIKMGDKTLTVRRANQGTTQLKPEQESVLLHAQQQIALQRLMLQPTIVPSKVVCLTEAVNADELKNDDDYEDILYDMRNECGKFGTLVNVIIPRPLPNMEPSGVGKVFLEYADIESATKARQELNGRKFDTNYVVAMFYSDDKFSQGDYNG